MIHEQALLLGGGLVTGILLDIVIGDPSNKYHPVSWLGKIIERVTPSLKCGENSVNERINGIIFSCGLIFSVSLLTLVLTSLTVQFLGFVFTLILLAILLKISIALKGMESCTLQIIHSIEEGNLEKARSDLSLIVRRNTGTLDEEYIQSATIECISESTVDGIISPIFYYSIFGPVGCIAFRVVNTLDSMIGYTNDYYKDIGWMSAKLDTIFNFVPARVTGLLIVVAASMVKGDWRNSFRVLLRDHNKTASINAGYPMSSMAGALRVKLEKLGSYTLGDRIEKITTDKCILAVKIMKITTILFCAAFSFPLIFILSYIGWWNLFFGF